MSERVTPKLLQDAIEKMQKGLAALKALQDAELAEYGFTHNEKDLGWIIDSVDYGGGNCTFKEYKRLMDEAKAKQNKP